MKDVILVGAVFVAGWFYFENQKLKKAAQKPEAPVIPGVPNPKTVSQPTLTDIIGSPAPSVLSSFTGEDDNPFN